MVRPGRAVGTLLGPEGTTRPALPVVPPVPRFPGWPGVVVVSVLPGMTGGRTGWSSVVGAGGWCFWWVVGWLWVENCTVDASILFFVVKLSRANGGCLGTRSR